MKPKSTIELVRKAVRGNRKAYGELISEYQVYLYKTAYLYTKNESDALDAVQDCVTNGMLAITKLREPRYFKTWITRILINSIYKNNTKKAPLISFDDYHDLASEEFPSIEEHLDLYEAIDSLRPVYKSVIILYYFQDMKIKEIAYAMNLPEGSVKAYLSRAKKELRNYLEEDHKYETATQL